MFNRFGRSNHKPRDSPNLNSTNNKTQSHLKLSSCLSFSNSSKSKKMISHSCSNQNQSTNITQNNNSFSNEKVLEELFRCEWSYLKQTNQMLGIPYRPNAEGVKVSYESFRKVLNQYLCIRPQTLSSTVITALRLYTFNNWEYSDAELINFVKFMFTDMDLPSRCRFSMETLENWLFTVYAHYNIVSFHNFKHAFMVTQMMYAIIKLTHLECLLSPLHLFVLLFSAICHDLDHPGFTNSFQVNTGSWLTMRYNDISPLENHHCRTAFDLIAHPLTNITQGLSATEYAQFRKAVIRCILSTDMAIHSDCVEQFRSALKQLLNEIRSADDSVLAICANGYVPPVIVDNTVTGAGASPVDNKPQQQQQQQKTQSPSPDQTTPQTKLRQYLKYYLNEKPDCLLHLFVAFIKLCDISNEIRPPNVADKWLDSLFDEFFAQANFEQNQKLPILPHMNPKIVKISLSQIGFISNILLPLIRDIMLLFPELKVLEQSLLIRLEHFKSMSESKQTTNIGHTSHETDCQRNKLTAKNKNPTVTKPSSPSKNK